jgi:GxxExxY protein
MLYENITEKIIQGFYKVYNTLGYGFLEKVYENALVIELKKLVLQAIQQEAINVYYEKENVGEYYADILVNGLIILELKAVDSLKEEHCKQLQNYLKATQKELGLLLNFGKKPDLKRIILTNNNKNL